MTSTADTELRAEPQGRSFTEHLVFVALLLPTFIVVAAAVVSFAAPDPSVALEKPIMTTATWQDGDDGP